MATCMEHMSTPMSTCGMSCHDEMSTDNGELVWVGFIDVLPVIGSIKEAVEFVLAAAGGDSLLAKEKESMMKVRLGLGEKTHSGRSTASSSGACSREEREAVHVEGKWEGQQGNVKWVMSFWTYAPGFVIKACHHKMAETCDEIMQCIRCKMAI